jgi:DNA polymerase-3 subunit chi
MQVDFYHLNAAPLERVLPRIAERVLEQGGRLLVVCDEEDLAKRLDDQLWSYAPDSFLPHGRAGEAGEEIQPVLISSGPEAVNRARNVAIADGLWREEALGFDRAFYFFDAATIAGARAAWRDLVGREGVEPRYWKQDDAGKWRQGP